MAIRILLADDHAFVRQALTRLLALEPDLEIIGQAGDGHDAVEQSQRLLPDVVLMDCSMPRLNGVEATRQIVSRCPGVRVIGLSMYDAQTMADQMITAGAVTYVPKSAPAAELISAIRTDYPVLGPARPAT